MFSNAPVAAGLTIRRLPRTPWPTAVLGRLEHFLDCCCCHVVYGFGDGVEVVAVVGVVCEQGAADDGSYVACTNGDARFGEGNEAADCDTVGGIC